jgi:hypothetical protein
MHTSNNGTDRAGQIVIGSSNPSTLPSGLSVNILGSGGTRIPATMVGGIAVKDKPAG